MTYGARIMHGFVFLIYFADLAYGNLLLHSMSLIIDNKNDVI